MMIPSTVGNEILLAISFNVYFHRLLGSVGSDLTADAGAAEGPPMIPKLTKAVKKSTSAPVMAKM
jgi:hypothetical protein